MVTRVTWKEVVWVGKCWHWLTKVEKGSPAKTDIEQHGGVWGGSGAPYFWLTLYVNSPLSKLRSSMYKVNKVSNKLIFNINRLDYWSKLYCFIPYYPKCRYLMIIFQPFFFLDMRVSKYRQNNLDKGFSKYISIHIQLKANKSNSQVVFTKWFCFYYKDILVQPLARITVNPRQKINPKVFDVRI